MHFGGFWEKDPYDIAILVQKLKNKIGFKNRSIGYLDFDPKNQVI